ncbi:hypothetical protein AUJ15_02185 [Candidatus Micrarchaeota archaeon CG1_02_55_41]|nr:MAG: hypothetical protein AUJ15_02185 [Candidatus Micrarchaeota archaeon CG1_02_55_41]
MCLDFSRTLLNGVNAARTPASSINSRSAAFSTRSPFTTWPLAVKSHHNGQVSLSALLCCRMMRPFLNNSTQATLCLKPFRCASSLSAQPTTFPSQSIIGRVSNSQHRGG